MTEVRPLSKAPIAQLLPGCCNVGSPLLHLGGLNADVTSGAGREPWERSEAGGVNDNERHLHHSPVSSPTEELQKE